MKKWLFTPTQVLAIGFLTIIIIGAFLLTLPVSTADGKGAPFLTALFTATSATCVTGLVVVDTGTYYSNFGQFIILFLMASYKGKSQTTIMERTLPPDLIQKAIILTFMAGILVFGVSALLTITESTDYLRILFETTSAFATVGLSLGFTPELSMLGKIIIIITMYIGRVGPLTLVYAFAKKRMGTLIQVKYPEERILIG